MNINKYYSELNEPEVQKYIDLVTTKYTISKDKVKKNVNWRASNGKKYVWSNRDSRYSN